MTLGTGSRVIAKVHGLELPGTIGRVLMNGGGAWVTLDAEPPDALRMFNLDDSRSRHVKFAWEELEAQP